MNLEILILIVFLGVSTLILLLALFITINKNKKVIKEKQNLENMILKYSASNRVIDSIEIFLSKNENTNIKLCESIRLITNAKIVIYSEMNKSDGSFKPSAKSSSNDIDLEKLETEYVDDKSLAIITGIEGTSKIINNEENDIFPKWFKGIAFESVISVPIIEGFETIGCVYIFLENKIEKNIDEFLKNIWIITNLFIKTKSGIPASNFESKEFVENSLIDKKEQKTKGLALDENLELLKFNNKEISLSNSEYLIMKKLVDKNGEVLPYEEIENVLWPNKIGINKSAMRLHIHRLRDKSNSVTENQNLIKTVRGKGIFLEIS
tara:strand:+ start:22 stop:987 length:966 start_codon:yes stop_codon:yes gene_type:complete